MKSISFYQLLLFILTFILFSGCPLNEELEKGQFPLTPVNFEDMNSEYDDYNSALPYELYNQFPYLFSSNRASLGNDFNIENFYVEFYYSPETNIAYFNATDYTPPFYDSAIEKLTTLSNELGPYLMYNNDYLYDILFYATDSSGNLDIYTIQYYTYETDWYTPEPLSKINTIYNEAYPTINRTIDKMYFCSDLAGFYDLYYVEITGSSLINWLETEDLPIWNACDILNSSSNDKCPYIIGNIMVFTSDRDGGYGGYDLYYSELVDGNWTEPINFGEEINSEYDEYRPVIMYAFNYLTDLMFFSSNRPGGLGGYDLYYVGIPKIKF
ncbi:hypothetical protein ACFLSE_00110 [Bacteroidota bacterium]